MTELMKRYEDGGDIEYLDFLENENGQLKSLVKQLKEQLRWRPVSEKPEESDYYIARFRFYGDNFISVGMLEYCTDRGWIPDVEVIEWFDIPPAPKGE